MKISEPARWFRMYNEFATDPKVQMLSEADQRRFVMILCLRCCNGDASLSDSQVAFQLRITDGQYAETKAVLMDRNLIDNDNKPVAWEKRQVPSDTSSERVKKYRETRYAKGLTSNGYSKHVVTVTERDGSACVYCGSTSNLCIDHVLPLSLGGDDSIENLVLACKACNSGKAGRTPDQAKYVFINKETERMWKKWMMSRDVTVTVTNTSRSVEKRERESKEEKPTVSHDSIVFDGRSFQNINGHLATWQSAYPAININAEMAKAASWLVANPKNRKSNYARFLNNWFSKAQDKAPATGGGQRSDAPWIGAI